MVNGRQMERKAEWNCRALPARRRLSSRECVEEAAIDHCGLSRSQALSREEKMYCIQLHTTSPALMTMSQLMTVDSNLQMRAQDWLLRTRFTTWSTSKITICRCAEEWSIHKATCRWKAARGRHRSAKSGIADLVGENVEWLRSGLSDDKAVREDAWWTGFPSAMTGV